MTTARALAAPAERDREPAPGRADERTAAAVPCVRFMDRDGAWAYRSRRFRALDHTFQIRADDDRSAAFLDATFAQFATDSQVSTTYFLVDNGGDSDKRLALYANDERVCLARTESRRLSMLLWHVNQAVIHRSSPQHVLLHAAAAERDGVCVVLPAEMESGKTTTVAGLLLQGYRYVTDEAVAIDPETLHVSPFPKALSVDRGSWEVLHQLRPPTSPVQAQWQVPPDAPGLRGVADRHPPRLVVTPRYVAGATTVLEPLSRGEAVLLLAQSTFEFAVRAPRNLGVAAEVARRCDAYRLTIGDLSSAVALIDALVDQVLECDT